MRRLSHRFVTALLAFAVPALGAAGCTNTVNSSGVGVGSVTTPTLKVTQAFSGFVNVNGAVTFTFAADGSGAVTATIKSISPDSAALMRLALGEWNSSTCEVKIVNDAATASITITGAASAAGNLCVRAYDIGKLKATQSIEITVTHF